MQKVKGFTNKTSEVQKENLGNEDVTESSAEESLPGKSSYLNKSGLTHKKNFRIADELSRQMQELAAREEITIFMIILQALHILFYKYDTGNEIEVGIPNTSVLLNEGDQPIQLFNSLVPLRNKISSEKSFLELLSKLKDSMFNTAEGNRNTFTLEDETTKQGKDLGVIPTHQILLIVENSAEECQQQFGLLQLSGEPHTLGLSRPDIQFFIKETPGRLEGTIEYNSELYREEQIDRIVNHLNELLVSILQTPSGQVAKYNILTAKEKHQLLVLFNDTKTEYPREKTLVNLFEDQVKANPDKVAVIFEDEKRTYSELNKRANQVAWSLLKQGIKKETLVPIFLERSAEMLIGMLGILKAGAVYVPIDPGYPADRITFMLEDTAAALIISSKKTHAKLPSSTTLNVLEIDSDNNTLGSMPVNNPSVGITSRNMAYIIYTSGSTGKPKGVMVEHQAVVDHCFGLVKVANLSNCTSFALFSPLVFDAGHSLIFTSIILGAALNILSRDLIMDGEKLVSYLEKNPVDCIKIVPSVWLSYINGDNKVLAKKVMIFGGETFSLKIQQHLVKLKYKGQVYNHYGPTEATIGKCIHKVDLEKAYKSVPIGKPFSNTQLYVVDRWDQLLPIGIAGELYIAGEGVARGYLNRPDLTAEKFIIDDFRNANPYQTTAQTDTVVGSTSTSRLYKTGDKVKWNLDGEIEYLGRIDDQVKISGYRIELGEIESVLLQNKKIRQAAVLLCEDNNGGKILVGYVVPEGTFDKDQIINQLQEKLPEYMVPGLWIELNNLPLTPNGKIDKKALSVPDFSQLLNNQYVAPQNNTEAALVKIWEDLLGIEKVGVYDSFFELGGNSIQAVTMFTRIRKHFGRELPLATIFQAPHIHKLAAVVDQKNDDINLSCLVPIQPQGSLPPLFCMHAGAGNVLFYNDLARNLGTNQPLYGLMARGLNGKEHFNKSIEEMATHYIQEIRSVQPNGPYFLAGYCLGGTIAFEMAKQLLKEGENVGLLATFNSLPATYRELLVSNLDKKVSQENHSLSSLISKYAGDYSSLNSKEKLAYPLKVVGIGWKLMTYTLKKKKNHKILKVKNKLARIGFDYYLSRGRLLPKGLRNKYMLHTNGAIAKAYKPGTYPGKMLVFSSPQIYHDPCLGWQNHVSGGIQQYDVEGKYKRRSEIMNDPFVKVISSTLQTFLQT